MLKFFFFVNFVAITHAADVKQHLYPNGPMFGGRSIDIKEVPYLVTVGQYFYTGGGTVTRNTPLCTGILISKNRVITTAQCVKKRTFPLMVRLNSTFRNAEAETAEVKYIIQGIKTHELFSVNEHGVPVHDLALLTIQLPDDPNLVIHSATLFEESEDLSAGVDALTTGWTNGHLTARTVPTLDADLCHKAYEHVGGVPVGQICAAYPGADGKIGCQGDSGAPLIVEGRVAGLLSWGNGCVKAHYPGLYTNIAYYRDWIERN